MRMLGRYSWRRGHCPCCGDSNTPRQWKRREARAWKQESWQDYQDHLQDLWRQGRDRADSWRGEL